MWKSNSHISEGSDSSVDSITSSSMSQMPTHGGGSSCHVVGRKKRRGMIEKRRRDRINNSLNELRRLVPAAFEKQGSAKLEKAEILQMTVDHLTMLHAKGFDAFSFDPHKFAMDYHSIGFRECASEVARYMVAVEGMDLQDPLRLRLMSHLQCYAAQRELALKSSAHASVWNPSAFTSPSQFSSSGSVPPPPALGPPPTSSESSLHGYSTHSGLDSSSLGSQLSSHMMPPPPPPSLFSKASSGASSQDMSGQMSSPYTSSSMSMSGHQMPHPGHQYFPGYGHPSSGSGQPQKHYRPWGAELAY